MRSGPWEVAVRPVRGGRITSLRLEGEELLDLGIGGDRPDASTFVAAGAWGWDEMVPNVEPTDRLPDHGEAWRLPWRTGRSTEVELSMKCRGRLVPWELTRSIHFRGRSLIALYAYRNVGVEPHLAYWCAHPLFRFESGMEVGVPGGERLARLEEGTSTKLFLPRGSLDHARLRWPSGRAIQIGWDTRVTPYVAVWACNGDLGGYRQIAIEPATGGRDRPDPSEPPPLLKPNEVLRWHLQIDPA